MSNTYESQPDGTADLPKGVEIDDSEMEMFGLDPANPEDRELFIREITPAHGMPAVTDEAPYARDRFEFGPDKTL